MDVEILTKAVSNKTKILKRKQITTNNNTTLIR